MQAELHRIHMASLPIQAASTQKHPVYFNYVITVAVQLPIGADTVVHFPLVAGQLIFGSI